VGYNWPLVGDGGKESNDISGDYLGDGIC
jgi:hypothetical protein